MDKSQLTLREKVAQLIFPRIGDNLPPVRTVTEDADRVEAILKQVPVGGLCVFNGRWPDTPRTLKELQEVAQIPLLIAADMERGAGQQVKGLSVLPDAMAFGALGPAAELASESFGRVTAEEALAAGVHIVLGPVADVNSDPRNPIIATRAFSTDTRAAARLAAAYVRGCQKTGAAAMAKHLSLIHI